MCGIRPRVEFAKANVRMTKVMAKAGPMGEAQKGMT